MMDLEQLSALSLFLPEDHAPVIRERLALPSLKEVEVLFVYGSSVESLDEVKKWLEEDQKRELVLIEDRPAAFRDFLQRNEAYHEQIHLVWKGDVHILTERFPSKKITLVALPSYASEQFESFREELYRSATLSYAHIQERLMYPRLCRNLFANFQRLPTAFEAGKWEGHFRDVPAIICGAGPSLNDAIPYLKELGDRALIIACGSAVGALLQRGVRPHLAFAIDPNEEEKERFENLEGFDMPLIYGNRLMPRVFDVHTGPHGYLRTLTGGALECLVEEALGIHEAQPVTMGIEGMSVTTTAIAFAERIKASPVIFAGLDLAYSGGQRYVGGVSAENQYVGGVSDQILHCLDKNGNPVETMVKWVMEADVIGAFAKNHPEIHFLNVTYQGLPIPEVPLEKMEKIMEICSKDLHLSAKIDQLIKATRLPNNSAEILKESLKTLRDDLKKCLPLLENLQQEGPLAVLAEIELEENRAYQLLLSLLKKPLVYLLDREEQSMSIWKALHEAAEEYLGLKWFL